MNSSTSVATTTIALEHGDQHIELEAVAGDHIAATIAGTKRFYEWQFLGTLAEYLTPGSLVVDVGANIGNHSLYFALVCGCDVLAFEPLPLAADILERNIAANGLHERVEVRRKALGEVRATAKLDKLDLANVGATTFSVSPDGEYEVSALDLEDVKARVSLIKVDAEGMDLKVLRGAYKCIERDRPIIACEAAAAEQQSELEQFASEVGYAFVAQFNATPTYVLAPSRTPLERANVERRAAGLMTSTHWATRDLYYRLGLVRSDLRSLSDVQETHQPAAEDPNLGTDRALSQLSQRVEDLERLVGSLADRLIAVESKTP